MKIAKVLEFLSENPSTEEFLKANPSYSEKDLKNIFKELLKLYSNSEEASIFIDGASKGNPGEAGAGFVIFKGDKEIARDSIYLGVKTNNEAEYLALISALEKAKKLGIKNIRIFTDSQLIANQIKGVYKVKTERIRKLHSEAVKLLENFEFEIKHIKREENKLADFLANEAIKKKRAP